MVQSSQTFALHMGSCCIFEVSLKLCECIWYLLHGRWMFTGKVPLPWLLQEVSKKNFVLSMKTPKLWVPLFCVTCRSYHSMISCILIQTHVIFSRYIIIYITLFVLKSQMWCLQTWSVTSWSNIILLCIGANFHNHNYHILHLTDFSSSWKVMCVIDNQHN